MNKTLFIIIFLFYRLITNAQTSFLASYNLNQTQINYTFSVKKDFKQHSLIVGLKIMDKQDSVKQQKANIFKHKFYPVNFKEALGFHFSYLYSINIQNSAIKPFIFYDFQFTKSSFISNEYTLCLLPEGEIAGFVYDDTIYGISTVYENNIGIGFTAEIYKNLMFFNRYGIGLALFRNIKSKTLMIPGNKSWEFSLMYNFGILYQLNSRK